MNKENGVAWKIGIFVIMGLILFVVAIYFIGKQQNIFGSTFQLKATFKTVSGLKVGNNIRFAGINVGTVADISILTDTSVLVNLTLKKEVQPFIKKDANASIGSEGLMGDKALTISPGSSLSKTVVENDILLTKNAIEIEDIMNSLKTTVDNANIITTQLAAFSYKINNSKGALNKFIADPSFSKTLNNTFNNIETSSQEFAKFTTKINNSKGALGKLVNDKAFAASLDTTMTNLQTSTKSLSDNMEAAKSSIFLRGFFNKKKRAEAKKQALLLKEIELKRKKRSDKNNKIENNINKIQLDTISKQKRNE